MRIVVNGRETTLEGDWTVRRLLHEQGLLNAPCAVEVNRALVSRRQHEDHALADGDVVEIVTLVGGG